jgi:hypothetical protein
MGRLSGRGTTGLPEGIRFEHGSQTPPDEFNLTNDRILWCTRVGDSRAELLHRKPKFWYEFTLRRNVKLFRIGGYTFEDDDTRIDPQSGREFFSTASRVDLNEFRGLLLEMLKDDPDAKEIADNYKTALREAVYMMPNTQFMKNKDEPQFQQIVQWTTMGARDNALIDAMIPVLENREYDGIIRVLPNTYEYIFFYPRDCLRVTSVTAVEPVVGPAPDAGGPSEGDEDADGPTEGEEEGDFDEFLHIAKIADDSKQNDAAEALLHMARGNAGAQAAPAPEYDNPAMYGPPGAGGQPAPPPPALAAAAEAPGGEAAAKRSRVKNVPDKESAEKDDTHPKKRGRGKALRGGDFLVPENNAPLPPGFLSPPFDNPAQLYALHFVGPNGAFDTFKVYSYNQAFRALMHYRGRQQDYTVSMHTNGKDPPGEFAQALYMEALDFGPPFGDDIDIPAPPLIPRRADRANAGEFAFAAPRANAGGRAGPVDMAAMLRV